MVDIFEFPTKENTFNLNDLKEWTDERYLKKGFNYI